MKSYRLSLLLLTISIGTTFAAAPQSAPKPQPLFSVGEFVRIYDPSVGEKEPWYVNDHCFIQGPDGKWHLFGITRQEPARPAEEDNFAHAVSPELYNPDGWVKQPFALSTDSAGGEAHLWAPYVIEHEGLYYMYYCAGGRTSHEYQIKLATSKDLYTWQRHPANPMMIDGFDARDPFILRIKDKWVMYYTATSDPKGGNHVVCSIESDDLIHWGNKKTVFTDPEVGTWGGPTESPFVVQRGSYYYLSIGPRDGYRGTCVYRSQDPFQWTIEQEVGRINSHAAEFIRDKDGRWFVSHCGWGQGGVFLAPLIWTDGGDDDNAAPLPSADANAKQTIRLPMSVYRDKMIAGWLGQIAGVAWGAPVEFKYLAQIMPENEIPQWKTGMINNAFGQDDLYVEMTFLKSLQDYGLDVTPHQAGLDFANSLYPLWHANEAGRNNLRKGIAPPDSGHPKFNAHADDIDYQIEADFAGLISPALPNQAVDLGNTFGRIMNYGDGLYGGQYVAAMYSIAFTESEPERIVTEALRYIPAQSQYAETIRDVLVWHRQYPDDWNKTWNLILEKYQLNPKYRLFSCDKGKFNIDAKINGAYIVVGLLYGQKNIEKTISISMQCGQDSDCNPSNAAGILFTTIGLDKLPAAYKAFDKTQKFIHTPYNLPDLFDVCQNLARQAVQRNGGSIEKDSNGNEILIIPPLAPCPNRLEQCFAPGPIANTCYTSQEVDKIPQGIQISGGPVAAGWAIRKCGSDMSPGYYETLDGRTSVLVTHPLDSSTGCSLTKEVEIPKDGTTALQLTVGRHPNGDWTLIVNADDKTLLKKDINADGAPERYTDINVDLSAFAGRKVKLELVNQPNNWAWEAAYWDRIDIITTPAPQPAAPAQSNSAESVFTTFVKVQGDQLFDENGPLRFISFNIPNLHYIEDQMAFSQTNAWSLPDEFEIADALEAVRQMGGQVVRTYTLSICSESDKLDIPRHILGPGQFNEEAFKTLDRVLAIANQKGIRIIFPFIDNWKWWGGVPAMAAFRGKQATDFWTDAQLFEDYKQIVSYVINRTNTITGIKYKDDKAILAWETGNELESPADWTSRAARFIKSIDSNHLVLDGFHTTVLRDSSITDANIDLVTTHHYDKDLKQTIAQIADSVRKSKGKKPYFVGEFGFIPTADVKAVLDAVLQHNITGALLWSLRFRSNAGGFYWHSEPYGGDLFKAYHWPGFPSGSAYDETAALSMMRQAAFQIRGLPIPPLDIPAAPRLLDFTDNSRISWQGSAGATGYIVEHSETAAGPWSVIGRDICDAAVQYRPLFADPGAQLGKSYYYRIKAQNSAGISDPSNVVGPVYAVHHALIDEMADMTQIHSHKGSLSLEAKQARQFKEDAHRLKGQQGSSIVYKTDEAICSFMLYAFFESDVSDFKIYASDNGRNYTELPVEIQNYFGDKDSYGYWVPVLYQGAVSPQQNLKYLKIEYTGPAQLSRVEIQYGTAKTAYSHTSNPAGFVKGFSWGWSGRRGQYTGDAPADSMKKLAATGANWVCISFSTEMETFDMPFFFFSQANERMVTDDEVRRAIQLARDNHLKVILKPVINVRDTTWRAWIKFNNPDGTLDMARWDMWWSDFRQFLLHYAQIAEQTGCEMFCLGCEMESTEPFEIRWRSLISEIRQVYGGPLTYNANHGREESIPWFDAVDIISLSAYFPVGTDDVEAALADDLSKVPPSDTSLSALLKRWKPIRDRLWKLSKQFNRPILFVELGVCNGKGCAAAPWTHQDPNMVYDADEQARYYQAAIETFWNEPWFAGFAWWEWPAHLYSPEKAKTDIGFCIYGKPAEAIVRKWYSRHK